MYLEESTDAIICNLKSKQTERFRSAVWKITGSFYQFTEGERRRILKFIIAMDENMIRTSSMWVASMINHILPYTPYDFRMDLVTLLDHSILSHDAHFVSYCLETIATMNYLLPQEYIHSLTKKIPSIAERPESFLLQNLLILCSSLLDFADGPDRESLQSSIDAISDKIGNASFFRVPPHIPRCDVLFYIPDFLTGKSFLQQPIGELTAAAVLEQEGISVAVLDNRIYHLHINSVLRMIRAADPRLVVITSSPYDQISVYYVDYRLKRIFNDSSRIHQQGFFTAVCGMHGTLRPKEILRKTEADVVVRGEWDLTISALYRGVVNGDLAHVPNIIYCESGMLRETEFDKTYFAPDVNALPIPDYSCVDMSAYYGDEFVDNEHIAKESWAAILTQRGCPYKCQFCCNFFRQEVRYRNPSLVVDELELLEKRYGIHYVFFIDYTFTLDHKWVEDVCREIIRRGLKIRWNCETRVDTLNNELLDLMSRANCNRIWLGAETFSDGLLDTAQKGIHMQNTIDALYAIRAAGIKVSCFIMVGLPGETRQTIRNTVQLLRSMNIEYTKSIIVFIPREGSAFFSLVPADYANGGFEVMNKYRGLLDNEITENDLMAVIDSMTQRHLDQENTDA